jgi:hypothetical protein
MSILIEQSIWDFLVLTLAFGGGAAYMTGRGLAMKWRPVGLAIIAIIPLTLGLRFLHFALFGANLTSLHYLTTDFLILLAACLLGYRLTMVKKMVNQYPWLYEQSGPLAWRAKS